ncbi:hypothetical protein YK48G_01220 [Lentilactobacillus fungorum]|uniref:Tyr recombinase domain-containing protein n=1 Tax=Lentilactobacillus fungorum TaxID=2201250 RepID=A0ABQ3VUY4_9LACO|nr:tyrosine-type recombinase/integrase [Lentilactobacillus fungorum]GHP12697.1 hypothetical protein YK48G_01220 [Lentilactobacillus fungorum]
MEQYEQILSITSKANPIYVPIQVAFNTGMRRGEICGLQWDCVNFDKQTIQVKRNMQQYGKADWKLKTPKARQAIKRL